MVTLVRRPGSEYGCDTGLTELAHVANEHRSLPDVFVTPDGRGVTPAFHQYALPLLGEPPLPQHPLLRAVRVES